jgi:hypothetical protein
MKKFFPFILIATIIFGTFGFSSFVSAQAAANIDYSKLSAKAKADLPNPGSPVYLDTCYYNKGIAGSSLNPPAIPKTAADCTNVGATWVTSSMTAVAPGTEATGADATTAAQKADAEKGGNALPDNLSCGVTDIPGCMVEIFYLLFYVLPAFLLGVAANFFNVIISLTISSALYTKSHFIPEAWRVVRDLSNIFFILVLLYIAIKVVLGMTGHGVKQTISQVVIMALLINFSMFFTSIVIDASNILALVFYNKIKVEAIPVGKTQASKVDYTAMLNPKATGGVQDKDLAGALVSTFNPSSLLTQDFFENIKTQPVGSVTGLATYAAGGAVAGSFIPVVGTLAGGVIGTVAYGIKLAFGSSSQVPPGMMIGLITVSGSIMALAAYAFFMAGISFLSRLIELWILIIASPFAFMSSAVPGLSSVEFVGWKSWLKHLTETAFMAPIFMFILYLIFLLVQNNIFKDLSDGDIKTRGVLQNIIFILIPAMVVLVLLNRATKYAKKSSGAAGEFVMGGIKAAGLLAAGGAVVGGAAILRGTAGATAKAVQQSQTTRNKDLKTFGNYKNWSKFKKLNPFAYMGQANKTAVAGMATLVHKIPTLEVTGSGRSTRIGIGTKKLGEVMQEKEKAIGKRESSIHTLDAKAASMSDHMGYSEKKKYADLTEPQQQQVRIEIDKDKLSKQEFGVEFKDIEDDATRGSVKHAVENAHANYNTEIAAGVDETTAKANLKAATRINKDNADDLVKFSQTNEAMGEFIRALRTGSYDLRNLSEAKAKTPGFNKFAVGLLAMTAGVMRAGLKKTGVDIGKSHKDFITDIGEVIVNSLKNVKVDVKDVAKAVTEHAGGHEGDHGGGHH